MRLSVSLEDEVGDAVHELAVRDSRSVSQMAALLIGEALRARERYGVGGVVDAPLEGGAALAAAEQASLPPRMLSREEVEALPPGVRFASDLAGPARPDPRGGK